MWRACDLRIEQGSPQAVFKFGGGRPPGFSAEVFPLLSVFAWFALSPPRPPHTHTGHIYNSAFERKPRRSDFLTLVGRLFSLRRER